MNLKWLLLKSLFKASSNLAGLPVLSWVKLGFTIIKILVRKLAFVRDFLLPQLEVGPSVLGGVPPLGLLIRFMLFIRGLILGLIIVFIARIADFKVVPKEKIGVVLKFKLLLRRSGVHSLLFGRVMAVVAAELKMGGFR